MNLNFTIYRQQEEFLRANEHFLAVIAGISAGKSLAGALRSGCAAYGQVGDQRIPVPNLGIVTAPTYTMLRDATIRTFREVAAPIIDSYNKVDALIKLKNGSEILFRSAHDPEVLRGTNAAWWWGDEAALYDPSVWHIMIGRLRQFGQFGYAWLTTTPKGRNWIWQQFVRQQRPDYRIIKARTRDNLFLAKAFIDGLEQNYVGDFARQELEGDFVAFEGLVYPHFDRATHISTARPAEFARVVAGVDWGFTNPGVIVVFGVDSDGRMWGLHEEYQRQRRIEEWAAVAKELRDVYTIDRFHCDPAEPTNIDAFNRVGCRAVQADNNVNAGIQQVTQRLVVRGDGMPRLIFAPGFANTIAEFEQYQWMPQRGGGLADKPVKSNDHTMDAVRYAVMSQAEARQSRVAVDYSTYETRMR